MNKYEEKIVVNKPKFRFVVIVLPRIKSSELSIFPHEDTPVLVFHLISFCFILYFLRDFYLLHFIDIMKNNKYL